MHQKCVIIAGKEYINDIDQNKIYENRNYTIDEA